MPPPANLSAQLRQHYRYNVAGVALGGVLLLVGGWSFWPLSPQALDPNPGKQALALAGLAVVFFFAVVWPTLDLVSARKLLVDVEARGAGWRGTTASNRPRVLPGKAAARVVKSFYSRRYECEIYQAEGGSRYYLPVRRVPR